MPVTAPPRPASRSFRPRRGRVRALPGTAGRVQAHRRTIDADATRLTDQPGTHEQPRVKPWQVALGFLALLCSGIDLG